MGWPKGKPRLPNSGRKKGRPNRITEDFKAAVTRLVNGADLDELLTDVPRERRLETLCRLAEYAFPKLGRTELTGADGEKLSVSVQINRTVKDKE
jgi:hypothetical protein